MVYYYRMLFIFKGIIRFTLSQKRITSVDTGRGFGIMLMILVHLFTHQIGKGLSSNFIPLVKSMHPILLGSLVPLIIMGVWGSAFTFLSCMALSAKIFQTDPKDNRAFLKIIISRIIGGFLLVLLYRIITYIAQVPNTESIFRQYGPIRLNFGSETLDSIAIVGVLVPIMLIIFRKIGLSKKTILFSAIMIGFAVVFLSMSDLFILWGRELANFFYTKNLVFFELCVSKFVYGRFKIAHTFSFGVMGGLLGYYIVSEVPEKRFMWFSFCFFFVGLTVLGIAAIFDWSFLLDFASNDVPLYVQFFNLGAQIGLFSIFNKYLEMGSPERRERSIRRTRWLRRFGVVSLSIFTVGRFPSDGVFWILEKILGPAVDFSAEDPVLVWNMAEIYLFMGLMMGIWFLILILWEKIRFIMSVEWLLSVISWLLRLKKTTSLYAKERIYVFTEVGSTKPKKEVPLTTK